MTTISSATTADPVRGRKRQRKQGMAFSVESNNHLNGGGIKETRNKKEKERKRPYIVSNEVFGSLFG